MPLNSFALAMVKSHEKRFYSEFGSLVGSIESHMTFEVGFLEKTTTFNNDTSINPQQKATAFHNNSTMNHHYHHKATKRKPQCSTMNHHKPLQKPQQLKGQTDSMLVTLMNHNKNLNNLKDQQTPW